MSPKMTPLESKVFEALKQSAEGNGGDFAISEDVDYRALKLSSAQFGALLTTLAAKGLITVTVSFMNGSFRSRGTRVTQVTF